MAKLTHPQWMAYEFSRLKSKAKPGYREALLHASFIEGAVCNKSTRKRKQDNFYLDIEWLFHNDKLINKDEQGALHRVRNARNKLVHHIVKEEASQEEIEQWRDDLMDEIKKAYEDSQFLKDELLMKYSTPTT